MSSQPGGVTISDNQNLGYAQICVALSARFGTRFSVETTGECTTIVAKFEGGIKVMVTDCGPALSPVDWHRDGRAAGFYVGVHMLKVGGVDVDKFEQLGYAFDVEAPPTGEAIGELIRQALAYARSLREAI